MNEMTSEQRFVAQAADNHPDATKYDPRDPPATWVDAATARPWNWLPEGALDRMRAARDPHSEAVEITIELMISGLEWCERPDTDAPLLPENPLAARYVTGTLARFQRRLVKGHEGEAAAEAHLLAKGVNLVEASDDSRWTNATEMENDGVDLVDDSGRTWQVKAYKVDEAERDELTADRLIEVTSDGVRERVL